MPLPRMRFRVPFAVPARGDALAFPRRRRQGKVDFEKEILPILDGACFKCHSAQAKKPKGDLRLDDVAAIRAKSRSDNLIFPRKPEKSLLFEVISLPEGDEDVMPPADERKPLAPEQIALIQTLDRRGRGLRRIGKARRRQAEPVAVAQEAINAADVAATARRIDELIEAGLKRAGRQPNPPVAEDLWCRRVHLDLIGRIPTYDEMSAFLKSRDPQKRAKLIDTLLASNGHVSTMFNYWCDTLRARDQLADNVRGDFYLHYIKESIRTNKPFDRWAREMVSPEGALAQTPAVGFYLRDLGNRFASVDNTAIVFLGTQIGCAQCHDHPYDEWSRKAYHQFAAWTSGDRDRRAARGRRTHCPRARSTSVRAQLEKITGKRTTQPAPADREQAYAMQIFEGMMGSLMRRERDDFAVRNGGQAEGQLPGDYKYPDGQPNQPIAPAVLFGEAQPQAGPASGGHLCRVAHRAGESALRARHREPHVGAAARRAVLRQRGQRARAGGLREPGARALSRAADGGGEVRPAAFPAHRRQHAHLRAAGRHARRAGRGVGFSRGR